MRWVAILAVVLTTGMSLAQSPSEYLALRKKHKITAPVSIAELDSFVGSKIFELKCTVNGIMDMDGKSSISAELGSSLQVIDAEVVPAWLKGGTVQARLLVKATREEQYGAVTLALLMASAESDVARFDVQPKKTTAKTTTTRATSTKVSRSASSKGRPLPAREAIAAYAPTYAAFIKNHNKRLSYDKAYEIASAVIGWSVNYNVDARLVMALLIAESDFNPAELSGPGATGLGQLMPETARELGVRNPWNTNENLYGTVKYLKTQMDRYGASEDNAQRLALALAAYNAGPGAVKKHGGVPPYRETQNYVRRILRTYRQLCGA
ncbi:MAG: transglycosylase SLT domain-containing protein [Armatimonadota bacterium]